MPTAGQVVPRVDVQNKQLKGLLMLDQYPWMVKLLDGRQVSPSEFERLAGSLRKNWKSSTFVLQVTCPPTQYLACHEKILGFVYPTQVCRPSDAKALQAYRHLETLPDYHLSGFANLLANPSHPHMSLCSHTGT